MEKIKVNFLHWRKPGKNFASQTTLQVRSELLPYSRSRGWNFPFEEVGSHYVDSRGGQTQCSLEIHGSLYSGWAKCKNNETFCYRLGREISIGRATKAAVTAGAITCEERKQILEMYTS